MTTQVTTLANGLRIVTDPMPSVETVALGVWVGAGTRHETAEVNGISHLLEHMAFKGTTRRTAQQIAEEMDNVGGQLNAYTSRDHTAYFAKVLKEDTSLATDILADILLDSTMDAEELAREQHVVVQEIYQAIDTPDDIIFDHLQAAAFPNQPLGWPVLGQEKIVQSISPDHLKAHMARHYAPEVTVIAASGALTHDDFVCSVDRAFGAVARAPATSPLPGVYAGGDYRESRELEQVHLVLGFPGLAHDDPDFYNLAALSTLLGEGMSSRLFQEIREKRGLAYAVYSGSQSFADTGLLTVYAGTGPDDVPQLVPVLCNEIKHIGESISADEVKRARAQLKAGLLMSLESPSSRCAQRARQLMVHGRLMSVAEIIGQVEAVDRAGISRAAARVLTGAPTVAAIGNLGNLEEFDAIRARLQ
ncbi:MAG: insulinase family protein [Rhodospirillaceae bacterium]|nr:MAG: insulinase family protein [Rhodospirillaceae bacterium]